MILNEECKLRKRIYDKKYRKIYRQTHKEEIKKYKKEYYQKNKQEILQKTRKYHKKYRDEHKKESKIYRIEYIKNKYKTNISFKLICCLRSRIYDALKKNIKSEPTANLLGCSVEFLKIHLEKQFAIGMTWQNWGKKGWEIDHIKPCASFDLNKKSEQLKCFNYKNLQPLWAKDNLKKRDIICH